MKPSFAPYQSVASALSLIRPNQTVFVHGGSATPFALLKGLMARAQNEPTLKNIEFIHLHTSGDSAHASPAFASQFRVSNLFVGATMRPYIDYDRIDYLPCFLSEIPMLFRSKRKKLDVALIHVSEPDAHGYCSLGTSVDIARAAVDSADFVIAQVNKQMPRVHGDGLVSVEQIDAWTYIDEPIPESIPTELSAEEIKIGENIASLVENGATLQAGIGAVPDAAMRALKNHRGLGLHTEMWSDGALELIQSGAIDNSNKKLHAGKSVSGFVTGSKKLYDFINDNPSVAQLDIAYVNNPSIIAKNPKVTAINSAVEIDLTGQICADSIGHKIISGVGGQMDFMRGAALSQGGKPIIALTSTLTNAKKGSRSRLVVTLNPGAGVVTTRANIHYVVTEYGIADLFGLTLRERAKALIQIAHPMFRDSLEEEWRRAYHGSY